ncbi:MAG: hypothetical protein EXR98_22950 [Gemmataceae bacterium]|nr:hypothetical protein [Gemmataceae bacterium]
MNIMKFATALCALALSSSAVRAGDTLKPVKVFILAEQSNMEGQAVVDLDGKNYNDGKGTLKALMNDPVWSKNSAALENKQRTGCRLVSR